MKESRYAKIIKLKRKFLNRRILPEFLSSKIDNFFGYTPTGIFSYPKGPGCKKEGKSIFLHIPKTAGVLIKYKLKSLPDYKNLFIGHLSESSFFERDVNYNGCFFYTIIRNPWDRLVSGFFHLSQKGPRAKYSGEVREKFLKPFNGNFDLFVQELSCNKELQEIVHFRSQVYWLKGKNKKEIDFIVRFENLKEDLKKLSELINIQFQAERIRASSQHRYYTEYYTERTKKIVRELYREDIETFGYDFEQGPANIVGNRLVDLSDIDGINLDSAFDKNEG